MRRVGWDLHLPLPVRLIGKSGLTMGRTRKLLDNSLEPKGKGILILHVGANNIGLVDDLSWLDNLEELVLYIKARFPGYRLVWSDMLKRTNWRYTDPKDGNKRRKRLQRRARKLFFKEGGSVLRHPILSSSEDHLAQDGVHLNLLGQEMFIQDITGFFL